MRVRLTKFGFSKISVSMENALYDFLFTRWVVSENSLVRCAHSFVFWYYSTHELKSYACIFHGVISIYLPQDIVDQHNEQVKKTWERSIPLSPKQWPNMCFMEGQEDCSPVVNKPRGPEYCQIKIKVERKVRLQGQWQKKNSAQPKLIKLYNQYFLSLLE